jgi:hypothetical protein
MMIKLLLTPPAYGRTHEAFSFIHRYSRQGFRTIMVKLMATLTKSFQVVRVIICVIFIFMMYD